MEATYGEYDQCVICHHTPRYCRCDPWGSMQMTREQWNEYMCRVFNEMLRGYYGADWEGNGEEAARE
jgi:hypothetical protein